MNKICFSLIVISAGLSLILACGRAQTQVKSVNKLAPLESAGYLHTRGKDIVDGNEQVVHLHGVNVGGWLVTEGWMNGQTDDGGRGALEQLEKRFGAEKAALLMKAWQDHWFTEKDLDLIASWKFNVIRVPFGYRNFQDAQGNWKRDGQGNVDFSRLDWVVHEAARRGIYVVFDLHIWPRQFEKDNYGLPSRWTDEGKDVREKMSALWSEVAKHFKGNGAVAGFDVINEPEGSPWNAPHRAFRDAIRAQDPERMIITEWSGYENMTRDFPTNTVYSDHYAFDNAAKLSAYRESLAKSPNIQAPIFLGEMKAGEDTMVGAQWLVQAMNKEGWSWAIWTYKAVNYGGWAAFNYDDSLKYDLSKDSYESLLEKWTNGLRQWQDPTKPKNYHLTQWWIDGFRQNSAAPIP